MSAAQFVVLVVATALITAGGIATVTAELAGAGERRVRRRWLDAVGIFVPYVAVAGLVWWMWQRS